MEWDVMFAKLAEQHRPMHNGKPRNAVLSPELKRWMLTQRQFQKRGELDTERKRKLDSIGFEWQPYSKQWEQMFDALQKFQAEQGHCRVPGRWPENVKLASWVATQRARKAAGKLSDDRIKRLDNLGFAWRVYSDESQPPGETSKAHDRAWEQMFAELEIYRSEHGDCKVPTQWPNNPKLANWVATQRQSKKSGKLKPERIASLNTIGFEWIVGKGTVQTFHEKRGITPTAAQMWEVRFCELTEYKQAHGNCLVPQSWKGNRHLANWVTDQRMAYRREQLDAERLRRLEELSFDWDPVTNKWDEMYQQLVEYKNQYGDTNVPQRSGKYTHSEIGCEINALQEDINAPSCPSAPSDLMILVSCGRSWNPIHGKRCLNDWSNMPQRLLREPLRVAAFQSAFRPRITVGVQRHALDFQSIAPLPELRRPIPGAHGAKVRKQCA
jgi:hypothetical protein